LRSALNFQIDGPELNSFPSGASRLRHEFGPSHWKIGPTFLELCWARVRPGTVLQTASSTCHKTRKAIWTVGACYWPCSYSHLNQAIKKYYTIKENKDAALSL